MGDRTTVTLVLLQSQVAVAEGVEGWEKPNEETEQDDTSEFTYYEVNYGNLDFLEKLAAHGIAYTSSWCSGSEYSAGTEYCRFTPEGDAIVKQIYDDGWGCPVSELMSRLESHEDLRAYILEHHEKLTILDMTEDQVEYGKLYRAKQLITPGG